MYLRLRKIVVQRVTIVKFGMYYGGSNDTGRFGIKIRTDAAKLTNVRIARFRECRDLVRECEVFVKNEAILLQNGRFFPGGGNNHRQ